MSKEISVSAKVEEETHLALRGLLIGKKLLPHRNFSDWLRAKEAEEVKGKRK